MVLFLWHLDSSFYMRRLIMVLPHCWVSTDMAFFSWQDTYSRKQRHDKLMTCVALSHVKYQTAEDTGSRVPAYLPVTYRCNFLHYPFICTHFSKRCPWEWNSFGRQPTALFWSLIDAVLRNFWRNSVWQGKSNDIVDVLFSNWFVLFEDCNLKRLCISIWL